MDDKSRDICHLQPGEILTSEEVERRYWGIGRKTVEDRRWVKSRTRRGAKAAASACAYVFLGANLPSTCCLLFPPLRPAVFSENKAAAAENDLQPHVAS